MAEVSNVDGDSETKRKRFKTDSSHILSDVFSPSILDLSDDVLLIILDNLVPFDLVNLSRTCSRLLRVSQDRTLWAYVDGRDERLDEETLEVYLSCLLPSTKSFAANFNAINVKRVNDDEKYPTINILKRLTHKCPLIHTLILEAAVIDANLCKIEDFPKTLKHLSLKASQMTRRPSKSSYFQRMHTSLPDLEVLVLTDCLWFESHSIMAVAKCTALKELRLNGCIQLGNCMAYCSMSARFAFKSLETLDLRGTRMGDHEVASFNRIKSLRHLYLEAFDDDMVSLTEQSLGNDVWRMMGRSPNEAPFFGGKRGCLIILHRINNEFQVDRQVLLRQDIHQDEVNHLIREATNSAAVNPPAAIPGSNHLVNHGQGHSSKDGDGLGNSSKSIDGNGNGVDNDNDIGQAGSSKHPQVIIHVGGKSRSSSRENVNESPSSTGNSSRENVNESPSSTGNSSRENVNESPSRSSTGNSSRENTDNEGDANAIAEDKSGNRSESDKQPEPKSVSNSSVTDNNSKEDDPERDANNSRNSRAIHISIDGPAASYREGDVNHVVVSSGPNGLQAMLRTSLGDDGQSPPTGHAPNNCVMIPQAYIHHPLHVNSSELVTDTSVYDLFGDHSHLGHRNLIRLACELPLVSQLETLVLRNYCGITDSSLLVLVQVPTLRYLDVTGTNITKGAIATFKSHRPDVKVISDFREDLT